MSMLEKVALAIWQERERRMPGRVQRMQPDNWDKNSGAWASTLADARAAIEAMREPTDQMRRRAIGAGWHNGIEGDEKIEMEFGGSLYSSMVDEALR